MGAQTFFVRYRSCFLIAVIVLLALFYLSDDVRRLVLKTEPRVLTVRDQITCATDRFTPELLSARSTSGVPIRVLVHFQEKPSADGVIFFSENGVLLQPTSWIFDYMVGDTDLAHLCFLATVSGVTKVDIGE